MIQQWWFNRQQMNEFQQELAMRAASNSMPPAEFANWQAANDEGGYQVKHRPEPVDVKNLITDEEKAFFKQFIYELDTELH